MKRAMGLVLVVLAFAVVAHADGIEYGRSENAGIQADVRDRAPFAETLQSSNVLMERDSIAFRAGGAFLESGDAERLTDYVFYSHFGDSEEVAKRAIESDSARLRLESVWGDHYPGLGEFLRVERPDPFRHELGVQDVSEPETLLLMGAGLAALALWKRRTSASEQPFARFF
jgi:hypothetical protein